MVAATGGLEHERLVELVMSHFAPPSGVEAPLSTAPGSFVPEVIHREADVQQVYVTLAARTVPDLHPDRYKLVVLNSILGGGMSSRLFQSVREEAGLAYSVYSSIDFYRDAGALVIQMGVSPDRAREALQRVQVEIERMRSEGPSPSEVDDAKNQLVGNLLLDHESVTARMFHLGGEEVTRRTFTSTEEVVERVRAVTHEQVCEIAQRYLVPAAFSLVALGPADGRPLEQGDWPGAASSTP